MCDQIKVHGMNNIKRSVPTLWGTESNARMTGGEAGTWKEAVSSPVEELL